LVAISVDAPGDSKQLADKQSISFPLLSDPEARLTKAFGVYDPGNEIAWPTIFVIDKDGTITWSKHLDQYKVRPAVSEVLAAVDQAKAK
jgi:peroxiredoxin